MPDNAGATPQQGDANAVNGADEQNSPSTDQQGASQQDEYAKLLSRIAGLDAKVTTLSNETKAERTAREAAEQKLRDYEAGKVGADEALRAQLEAKERELEQTRREATVAKIAQAYPETFGVFGDAVVNMSADQLAAAEARFAGTPGSGYRQPNAGSARTQGGQKDPSQMSLAELREAMRTTPQSAWQSFESKPMRDW